jgi:tyrosyl-tRNA synthetase
MTPESVIASFAEQSRKSDRFALIEDKNMTFRSDFLNILHTRGFIHQGTDMAALDALLSQKSVVGYIGFDATAESLHVGSLVCIMMLRWLQKTGHQPLVLLGGGTTRVGDPSGKDAARLFLQDAEIATNIQSIQKDLAVFLDFEAAERPARLLNNADWLLGLNYIDFLRDYGKHFSINRMLTFDSVRLRLEREQSLSFLEFNYMILQAYDFYHLYQTQQCQLQMGGSDQWGNIVNGVELTRRVLNQSVYGLTAPLITQANGAKMGKSVSGAVWLSADKLSPYDYWQFWRNTADADVGRYLRLFTEIDVDEIERLENLRDAEINVAKKILADEATKLAHGTDCLDAIHNTVSELFEHNSSGHLDSLLVMTLSAGKQSLIEALVVGHLAPSKTEARRLIRGGGVRLNDVAMIDENYQLQPQDFAHEGKAKLSVGKKRHVLVILEE